VTTPNRRTLSVKKALLACLVALLTAHIAQARPLRRVVPIRVRMWTYVGEKPPDARPEFSWYVGFERKRYQLHITKMIVLTGSTMPLSIDSAVSMYPVQFQLIGEKTAVQHFLSTPPGELVQISGYLRIDGISRYFMLDHVTPAPTATPASAR
jgi:hypothetical protein